MATFILTVDEGTSGMFRFQRTEKVQACSDAEAVRIGRSSGWRVRGCEQLFEYHVTLRGHADKRRRETFVVTATSEARAIQCVAYLPAAWTFAHLSQSRKTRERLGQVVKVERREV